MGLSSPTPVPFFFVALSLSGASVGSSSSVFCPSSFCFFSSPLFDFSSLEALPEGFYDSSSLPFFEPPLKNFSNPLGIAPFKSSPSFCLGGSSPLVYNSPLDSCCYYLMYFILIRVCARSVLNICDKEYG